MSRWFVFFVMATCLSVLTAGCTSNKTIYGSLAQHIIENISDNADARRCRERDGDNCPSMQERARLRRQLEERRTVLARAEARAQKKHFDETFRPAEDLQFPCEPSLEDCAEPPTDTIIRRLPDVDDNLSIDLDNVQNFSSR